MAYKQTQKRLKSDLQKSLSLWGQEVTSWSLLSLFAGKGNSLLFVSFGSDNDLFFLLGVAAGEVVRSRWRMCTDGSAECVHLPSQ